MSRGFLNLGSARLGVTNNVAIATTSTAVASSAFGSNTFQIRINAQSTCTFRTGDGTPTATSADAGLPVPWVEYVTVSPGQKISIWSPTIQTISVTEITG